MPKQENGFMIVWRLAYPILIFYAVELLTELAFGFMATEYILENAVGVSTNSDEFSELLADALHQNATYLTLCRNLVLTGIFAWLMWLDRRKDILLGRNQAYKKPHWAWFLAIPVVGATAALGFNDLVNLTGLEKIDLQYQKVSSMIYNTNVPTWLTILVTTILAPIAEELIFRGVIYKRMRNHVNVIISALISAALFGLIHGNWVQGVYSFLVGMVVCWVYETFKTIWAPILFHAGANLISVILTFYAQAFMSAEMSLGLYMLVTVAWLAGTFMILWLFYKKIHCAPVEEQETGEHS